MFLKGSQKREIKVNLMSRRWISERGRDPYFRMAKELGYRTRSAFKLKQLNDRFGFLKKGKYVLDLGAAPGGWLQVASEIVGERGLVVGVDLEKVKSLEKGNVKTIVGDIIDEETIRQIKSEFPRNVDVILSDIAPNVSGIWEVDHQRQIHLTRKVLEIAKEMLKSNGWIVMKVFQGSEYEEFLNEVRNMFEFLKVVKPLASRKKSAEIFFVVHNIKPRAHNSTKHHEN